MSSRVREGFVGVFFETDCEGVEKLEREVSGLAKRGWEGGAGVGTTFVCRGTARAIAGVASGAGYEFGRTGVLISGGSDEGGSEPMLGLSGVRKGDLNGFLSVFVASFSLRRLACGVDILACAVALGTGWISLIRKSRRKNRLLVVDV
jgi:hypothetical protein